MGRQKLEHKGLLSLTPQQIQYLNLLQTPLISLEKRIEKELEENPALEEDLEEEKYEEEESSSFFTTSSQAKDLNTKIVLVDNQPIDIKSLISLIYFSKFIISNDTGPAHIASHLNKKSLVLFGSHTSAKKESIENSNLKKLRVKN